MAKQNTASAWTQVTGMLEPFREQRPIDLTVFVGQWPTRLPIRASAEDLSAMANQYQLTGMCVSHIASIFGFDTRLGNEELFRIASSDDRIWPYVILNPVEPGWELELDWAVQMGARGVRLVPGYHDYSLLEADVSKLAIQVQSLGLPLHVCARLEDERLVHPRLRARTIPFHELAELLRGLRVDGEEQAAPVMISGLRAREWGLIEELLDEGHSTEHILLDLWFTNGPMAPFPALCRSGYASRLAYGSGTPIQTPEATIMQLATADISDVERKMLCRDNAARLIGIAHD